MRMSAELAVARVENLEARSLLTKHSILEQLQPGSELATDKETAAANQGNHVLVANVVDVPDTAHVSVIALQPETSTSKVVDEGGSTSFFYVSQGTVQVHLHATRFFCDAGSHFYVPASNFYQITNMSATKVARLVRTTVVMLDDNDGEPEAASVGSAGTR